MIQLYPEVKDGLEPLSIYDDLEFPEGKGDRPFVALNMVTSIDGKITFDLNERRTPIGSPVDRTLMGRLRVHFDAVMRGAETVRANPYLPSVPEEGAKRRTEAGHPAQPLAVVISHSLDLPWRGAFFHQREQVVVFTVEGADPKKMEEARSRAQLETAGVDSVDLAQVLRILGEKYGVRRVLAEGGAALNYHLLRSDLLDELFWTLAPKFSGFEQDKTMVAGASLLAPTPRMTLHSLFLHDDELFHRWVMVRED